MRVLVFWNSGYTPEDERNRLEQSTGVAWVYGLRTRDRRAEENAEAMGAAQAWEPEIGVLGLWAEAGRGL